MLTMMSRSALRNKAARRIKRFEITEKEIERVVAMSEWRNSPDREPFCREPYGSILSFISGLSDHKRHDLMCLMYLGRNIDYTGFDEEAVDDFCFYADEWGKKQPLHGGMEPVYLAGKVHIGKWLRLATEAIFEKQPGASRPSDDQCQ